MTDEAEIHKNKLPNKTYISPGISTPQGALRIASKVIDSEGLQFAKVKHEVVLRRTPTGRTEIIAKFLECDRSFRVVTLQAFNGSTGSPQKTYFSFVGSEIQKLLIFFKHVSEVDFSDSSKLNITDDQLEKLVLSREQAARLVQENQEIFSEAAQSQLTKEDMVALGYRKKQLSVFRDLLNDRAYFDNIIE